MQSSLITYPNETRPMQFWRAALTQAEFEFDEWADYDALPEGVQVMRYRREQMRRLLAVISYCRVRYLKAYLLDVRRGNRLWQEQTQDRTQEVKGG